MAESSDSNASNRGYVRVQVTITGTYVIDPADLGEIYGDANMTFLEAVNIDREQVESDPLEAVSLMEDGTISIRLDIPAGIERYDQEESDAVD